MVRALLRWCVDFIIPPRHSERAVRALTLQELYGLGYGGALPYRDTRVQALVWELKYFANRRAALLCGDYLAEILLALAAEELGTPLLVPVPMHRSRRVQRGHNQTEVLCMAALARTGSALEYAPKALRRIRHTPTQQGLPRAARLTNVRGSMAGAAIARGRACVVVDDVTTTGATLEECERALKAAGAARVYTLALARSY